MEQKEIKLDITPEVAKGTYSNMVVITHSPTEMVIDFAQMLPGNQNTPIRERIIMDPVHAKRFLSALADNIKRFEKTYGPIVDPMPSQAGGRSGDVPYSLDSMGEA